ncbi:MAG TPA: L,D-transpeptidase family protein [candidate division Zixibacteria bacterium]|nr:L,D-transpeptidase family protein [candidate division Zixibacteria bacterium]
MFSRAIISGLLLGAIAVPFAAAQSVQTEPRVDRVVVYKTRHELQLWSQGTLLKAYRVALGPEPVGRKQRQGDGRTPEGDYVIDFRNPRSLYHLSLHVSYPNDEDRRRAAAAHVSPGGDIMIHGVPRGYESLKPGQTVHDWTAGCIAVTNSEIEEIWRAVPDGTPIHIEP